MSPPSQPGRVDKNVLRICRPRCTSRGGSVYPSPGKGKRLLRDPGDVRFLAPGVVAACLVASRRAVRIVRSELRFSSTGSRKPRNSFMAVACLFLRVAREVRKKCFSRHLVYFGLRGENERFELLFSIPLGRFLRGFFSRNRSAGAFCVLHTTLFVNKRNVFMQLFNTILLVS